MATGRVPTTANSPLTAKGDLFGYSTTQARVPVGSDGETLVADSSASTGLRWQGNFAAGKNKLVNADFRVNQRSFSSTTTNDTYTFDRWKTTLNGTQTYSAQTFTPGTAPVAGYEGTNFMQIVTTTGATSFAILEQRIEDVRTFANQTVTLSFWAKANSGTPLVAGQIEQNFGSGGSSAVNSGASTVTISTSWARYSITFAVPSISGKTIGTSSYLGTKIHVNNAYEGPGQQANTFQIWGVQLEAGNTATAFQTATGTLAGELAACQRYFEKSYHQTDAPGTSGIFGNGIIAGTNGLAGSTAGNVYGAGQAPFKVTKRAIPTMNIYDYDGTINAFRIYPADSKKTGLSGVVLSSGDCGGLYFSVNNTGTASVASNSVIMFNWTASAEL